MGFRVLLIARAGLEGWWGKTALRKAEFDVSHVTSYAAAFQELVKNRYDLFVVENPPGDTMLSPFLDRIRASLPSDSPHAIVVSASTDPALDAPPVSAILHPPFRPERFDEALVSILDLKTRAAKRYLVHPFMESDGPTGKPLGLATTLALNTSGMLIESSARLPIKKKLMWTFGGVPQLKGVVLPGTITEEASQTKRSGLKRYMVRFEDGAPQQQRQLAKYLEEDQQQG
jgi:hypothetical protein